MIITPSSVYKYYKSFKMVTVEPVKVKSVLSSKNFFSWKNHLVELLTSHHLEEAIKRNLLYERDAKFHKIDKRAKRLIKDNLCEDDFQFINGANSAYTIWNQLERKYYPASRKESFKQLRIIGTLSFTRNTFMEDLRKFRDCINRWNIMGESKLEQRAICELLISYLPVEHFESLITECARLREEDLKFDQVYARVLSQAEQVFGTGRSPTSKFESNSDRKCYRCGETGHLQRYCVA